MRPLEKAAEWLAQKAQQAAKARREPIPQKTVDAINDFRAAATRAEDALEKPESATGGEVSAMIAALEHATKLMGWR